MTQDAQAIRHHEKTDDFFLVARIRETDAPESDALLIRLDPVGEVTDGPTFRLTFAPQRRADPPVVRDVEPEFHHPGTWLVQDSIANTMRGVTFEIRWRAVETGTDHIVRRSIVHTHASDGKASTVPQNAPRLVEALNDAPLPAADLSGLNTTTPGKAEVSFLLNHIMKRLDAGLEDAWAYAQKHAGEPVQAFASASLEEQWARLFAEMFLGARYAGPGYFIGSGTYDAVFLRKLQDEPRPPYPLTIACQQLTTAALVTYGFKPLNNEEVKSPSKPHSQRHNDSFRCLDDQASGQNEKSYEYLGGIWLDGTKPNPLIKSGETHMSAERIKLAIREWGLGPCSSLQFHDGPHIAPVLRITQDRTRLQFMDVRGMRTRPGPEREAKSLGLGLRKGSQDFSTCYDDPFTADRGVHGTGPFVGIGLLPGSPLEVKTIEALKEKHGVGRADRPAHCPLSVASITRMRAAYPMGFCRLVLLERTPTDGAEGLLYASPLLRMHTDDYSCSLARLMWSLRDQPLGEAIQAVWYVDTPLADAAKTFLETPREQPRKATIDACLAKGQILPYLDLEARPGGKVRGVPRNAFELNRKNCPRVPSDQLRPLALRRLDKHTAHGKFKELGTDPGTPAYLRGGLAPALPPAEAASEHAGGAMEEPPAQLQGLRRCC